MYLSYYDFIVFKYIVIIMYNIVNKYFIDYSF